MTTTKKVPLSKTLKAKINKAQKEINKLKNQLVKDSEKLFKISCKEIFKKHKDFKSFAWTQYTPYWNDGDTCEFYAHTDDIYINDESSPTGIWNFESFFKDFEDKDNVIKKLEKENKKIEKKGEHENNWQYKRNLERIKELNEADFDILSKKKNFLTDVGEILGSCHESLESMFGDHCKVTVTKNGIHVESFDHD